MYIFSELSGWSLTDHQEVESDLGERHDARSTCTDENSEHYDRQALQLAEVERCFDEIEKHIKVGEVHVPPPSHTRVVGESTASCPSWEIDLEAEEGENTTNVRYEEIDLVTQPVHTTADAWTRNCLPEEIDLVTQPSHTQADGSVFNGSYEEIDLVTQPSHTQTDERIFNRSYEEIDLVSQVVYSAPLDHRVVDRNHHQQRRENHNAGPPLEQMEIDIEEELQNAFKPLTSDSVDRKYCSFVLFNTLFSTLAYSN